MDITSDATSSLWLATVILGQKKSIFRAGATVITFIVVLPRDQLRCKHTRSRMSFLLSLFVKQT